MKTEEKRQTIHLFRLHQQRLAQTQLEAAIERHAQSEADRRRVFLDAPQQPSTRKAVATW
jgi:capsule polysaccharide export protein KpsE/RkpR